MFTNINDALFKIFGFVFCPMYSCPDSAMAIRNALVTAHGSESYVHSLKTVATCYYHVKQAIEVNKHKFKSEVFREQFEEDIENLHSLTDDVVFQQAHSLFESKWLRKDRVAATWFVEYWGSALFHASATGIGLPVSNSVLERDNRDIKEFTTDHKKLGMGNFLKSSCEELEHITSEYAIFGFKYKVCNSRKNWGDAQLWLKNGIKKYIRKSDTNINDWYIPSSEFIKSHPSATSKVLKERIYLFRQKQTIFNGENLHDYYIRVSSFYVVSRLCTSHNKENFFSCTCCVYYKYATCKHSLGMSMLNSLVDMPNNYVVNCLQDLKEGGRPKKLGPCMKKT